LKCRHCGLELQQSFLDLGHAPPSNAYLTATNLKEPEVWFPLRLMVCENCHLVQTEDYAGREALFTDDYAYFSSFSSSWLDHAKNYVVEMIKRFGLTSQSIVVEVAANDGYLLQYVKSFGIACYGIEPTASTAKAARAKGIDIVDQFFGVGLADSLVAQNLHADLITANNVLAHVPDINDFVSGFSRLLKQNGVATFEFPHLLSLVRKNQFDTVYHEHYSYLSLTSVQKIFATNGLTIFDVEELPTHGGSLRVFAQRTDTRKFTTELSVNAFLEKEKKEGITTKDFYNDFQQHAETVKNNVLAFLIDAKRQGKMVAGYGAAAKANTLFNFAGVRPDLVLYIVDKNPAKQNRFMPGSHIPIVDEAHLKRNKPDYILILPWNIKVEVIEQLAYAQDWGAKFVVAVPNLQITSFDHFC
jgi:SAM-dependent methyltransferase